MPGLQRIREEALLLAGAIKKVTTGSLQGIENFLMINPEEVRLHDLEVTVEKHFHQTGKLRKILVTNHFQENVNPIHVLKKKVNVAEEKIFHQTEE